MPVENFKHDSVRTNGEEKANVKFDRAFRQFRLKTVTHSYKDIY